MNKDQARTTLAEVFRRIAPGVDLAAIDPRAELRYELDIDSMDLLNAVIAIHERTGVEIPDTDYGEIETLDGFVEYLVSHG